MEPIPNTNTQPLSGVTVIDFTQAYSGPFCTMQLADFGANVIKIERIGCGDQAREWAPIRNGGSGYFAGINRNKKGIALNLMSEKGVQIARRLIGQADILVENFKIGTMDKLGLGYGIVSTLQPDIIYASLSGFGQSGPLRSLAAYDNVVQAMSGLMEMTGFPDEAPVRIGPAIGDSFTGLNMALAILMAYYHKLETGEGQQVDVSMLDSIFSILESPILFKTLLNKKVSRNGNNDAETLVPYDVYACSDGYFSVGIASESGWPKFCKAVGIPGLQENPHFVDNAARCVHYQEFTERISPFFLKRSKAELTERFSSAGLPTGAVQTIEEVMHSPQMRARGMLIPLEDPNIGNYTAIGNPMKLTATPPEIRFASPRLGQDSRTVLQGLGYSGEEIDSLLAEGIVGTQ